MKREIVIYYSRNKENYCSGIIKNLEIGNTKKVANLIKDYTYRFIWNQYGWTL